MKLSARLVEVFLFLVLLATTGSTEPLTREQVPAPLAPWVDWVLHDAEDAACPFVHGNAERRQCVWPARLRLELDATGGSFRQEWQVFSGSWISLPGDARSWPEDVLVDGVPAGVVSKEAEPRLRLGPGRHVISGRFTFAELPDSLRIPGDTGLVSLLVEGRAVPLPDRDLAGRLWLRRKAEEQEGGSRVDVIVHRRIIDDVPLLLDTRIELKVSGPAREVLLGGAVPEPFVAMSLDAPLPMRVEADGRLRVQVRPGTWQILLRARHRGGPVAEIALPGRDAERDDPWDDEEVWVFDARNDLRVVELEGVPGIDPQQTALPDDWKHLPAYLMLPGARLKLVEKRRGDEDPAADQLTLTRTLWLDFDGDGYTVHDVMSGVLSESWRLEVAEAMDLGRVAIDGRDQFLSRLEAGGRSGVEVRQGQVDIEADSRMNALRGIVPAVGWAHDFQRVTSQLNLPPGWRLFHASGVDDVRTTWIAQWSLLDIFLVLITAMVVAQLYGWVWGALALAALVLSYLEPGAPRIVWLVLLGTQALLRVLPEGRLTRAMRVLRLGTIAVLAMIAIPFAVQQARVSLYPALEFPHLSVAGDKAARAGVVPAQEAGAFAETAAAEGVAGGVVAEGLVVSKRRASVPMASAPSLSNYYAPDPAALVSTGPGLPHWAWRTVTLEWRGPVAQDQQIRLFLLGPWANFALAWLRIGLSALLVFCVLGVSGRLRALRGGSSRTAALLLVGSLAGFFAPSPALAADLPPKELLDELRTRLLEPPDCFPNCAASPRMQLEVEPTTLRVRIEIDAAAQTAVPLPGGLKHWVPDTVLVDGAPATGLAHSPDGRLWVPLAVGKHQVSLEGRLPQRDAVQIPLPLKPHRVIAKRVSGWVLAGVRKGGEADESLQLTRKRDPADGALATLEAQDLPPFVRVERTLRLGLSWQVDTRVVRVSPKGRVLFVELPLLLGESVTTETVQVKDGRVQVSMAADASAFGWSSVLANASELALRAPDDLAWTELWRLDVSPLWHVETTGIPAVHSLAPQPIRVRQWQPWPGEKLDLAITRPGAIAGRTLTIDRATLAVRPGLRASEYTLDLSIRASRGLQHAVALPEGADLQRVMIDGAVQPIRAVDGRAVLPVRPGAHQALLVWRSTEPIGLLHTTPSVDPGAPSVNAEIHVAVPEDRWVLFLGGPRLGPAVLFWSLLAIALLVALALGRVPLTPLGWGSWFLLFIGMSQVPIWASLIVVGWLLALGWRRDHGGSAGSPAAFDALQLLLAVSTFAALVTLLWAVQQGLLGLPDMQIRGNGSSRDALRWYHDRSDAALPTAWMFSVPIFVYRLAMLAWALWLARALVGWLRWGWECFSAGELWRNVRRAAAVDPE